MSTLSISLVPGARDNRVARLDMSWPELAQWLTEDAKHEGPKESLPGWIPATFVGKTRGNAHVEWVTCGVLDLDSAGLEDVEELHERLRGLQLDYAWHTSYSHMLTCAAHDKGCPEGCPNPRTPKYRFVVRLSRPVAAGDWLKVWTGLAELAPRLDKACKDPTRLYFVPGHRTGTPHDAGSWAGGTALDVDVLIAHASSRGPTLTLVGDAPTLKAWKATAQKHVDGMSAQRAIGGRAMLALAAGEPFAESGQRDTALFQIAAILATKYPHTAPALLVDTVRAELVKQTADERWQEGDGAAELEAKIARCQQSRDEEVGGLQSSRLDQLGRTDPYTEVELREWLFQLGLRDTQQLALQLVVHCRGTYYVFWEGAYLFAGSKESGEEFVRQRLQAAITLPGVTLQELTPKGVSEKSMTALSRQYGTPVESIVSSLCEQHTRLDLRARPTRLIVATAPRDRRRVAAYSTRAEQFLRRMCESDGTFERLCDWLATAPKLERATAALYLHGARRTGKTQLAQGLAAIWGHRPTELEEVGASFNEHVARSPVVLADESMPFTFQQDSGKLRKLITATTHALRQKYQDNQSLEGALRVILAANNLNMLHHPSETLEQWDIDAICERVLYISCGTREAEHVPVAEIADHILWLESTRSVAGDGRLWVTGVDSALHRALRTRGRHRAAVCQWLLKFVENPRLVSGNNAERFRLDASGLWVAPRLLHETWSTYMGEERRLELPQLTAAIYEISERGLQPGLVRVRLEDLWAFAEQVTWSTRTYQDLLDAVHVGGLVK